MRTLGYGRPNYAAHADWARNRLSRHGLVDGYVVARGDGGGGGGGVFVFVQAHAAAQRASGGRERVGGISNDAEKAVGVVVSAFTDSPRRTQREQRTQTVCACHKRAEL